MDRSTFLTRGLLGLSAAGIGSAIPVNAIPLHEAPKKNEVKITEVKTYQFKKATYIKIETNTGISGWGESDGANRRLTPFYLEKNLKKYLIGKDPFASEGIWSDIYLKELETGIGGLMPGSLAGIDNALWDLKGKILGKPVHMLLGSNGKTKIRVYGSYGRDKGNYNYRTPADMAKIAADFVSQGYKAVKARMQIRQENVNPWPDDTYECVKEVRAAIGDDIELYVDFNNGYTPTKAVMVAQRIIDDFDVSIIEEPVFQQDYSGLADVVRDLKTPVAAGEHEYNLWMMKDLITIANVDYINADVIKCGGITECKKVAALAHAFGKQIMLHNAKPTLASAASLNLLASIPNGAQFQEYAGKRIDQGYGPLHDLFENEIKFEDGFLYVPQEPGLGLIVNEKAMEKNKDK